MLNPKKPLKLRNNTKYFNPETSRVRNTFSSPNTYQSRQQKIEGYETRLYWQFRYCEDHSGQTFFYTLTYNDKAMPHVHGFNCFDYEDLRDLLTGGFRKQLLRKYGTTFKYFIGAELGDGKGERGMHNNPHYHVLFFLEPANNQRFPYKRISSEDFRHLVRLYWQGFDEDTDGFHDYNDAKYGIAREGENCGLVTDFRACCYVSKYVCKDAKLKMREHDIERSSRFYHKKHFKRSMESYRGFFKDFIVPEFNIPLNPKRTEWAYTDEELVSRLLPHFNDLGNGIVVPFDFSRDAGIATLQIINVYHLWDKYYKYCYDIIATLVREDLNEYRNRYCNKCRISHGVGDYALEKITDKLNPVIKVPSKKGFKSRPLSMYYYRKLFTEVHLDEAGSPIRILNELGRLYKLSRLGSQLDRLADKAKSNFSVLLDNPDLFNKMRESDVNTEVHYDFSGFFERWNYLLEDETDKDIIFKRYAEYKLIYEDRFFAYHPTGDNIVVDFPVIDLYGDYGRFLVPSFGSVRRSDIRLNTFLETGNKGYMAYSEHPYFLRFLGVFGVLDLIADYLFVQGDNVRQKDAEERIAVKRFHDREKIKEFYRTFQRW